MICAFTIMLVLLISHASRLRVCSCRESTFLSVPRDIYSISLFVSSLYYLSLSLFVNIYCLLGVYYINKDLYKLSLTHINWGREVREHFHCVAASRLFYHISVFFSNGAFLFAHCQTIFSPPVGDTKILKLMTRFTNYRRDFISCLRNF